MLDVVLTLMVIAALAAAAAGGDASGLSAAVLGGSSRAVNLCLTLGGSMALWGGLMRVAERCGVTKKLSEVLSAPLSLMFRGLKGTRAMELISLNTAANLLGLGNAATPPGLDAMKELKRRGRLGGADAARLLLLNTASIQLIPVTVAALRQTHGAAKPWECTLPTAAVSAAALAAGLLLSRILYARGDDDNGADGTGNDRGDTPCRADKAGGHSRGVLRGRG